MEKPTYGQLAIDAAKAAAQIPLGPLGPPSVDLMVRLGTDLLVADTNRSNEASTMMLHRLKRESIDGSKAPAIIGLGRCGCRVTASLAQMIAQARGNSDNSQGSGNASRVAVPNWLSSFLNSRDDKQAYTLDPILVVGDLNVNTFAEIKGLIRAGGSSSFADSLLLLDYTPIASDGAGNIPIFGEYFTRALLSLSPDWRDAHGDWELARSYLLDAFEKADSAPKLAFYIFGAAGGSGSGGAMELHRAQRAMLSLTSQQTPRIYFSGIAVIPDDFEINDHQQRNTGRLILQYLSDLDIQLNSDADYAREVQPRYGTRLHAQAVATTGMEQKSIEFELPVPPWDSLGIVSNQIMSAISSVSDRQSTVDERANQYIAQQIFNLAYSQSAADALKERTDVEFDDATKFQAVKLDVEDLINGLCGPYAVGFAASEVEAVSTEAGVDSFFVRAIDVPNLYASKSNPALNSTIQGISICPQRRAAYSAMVSTLRLKIDDVKGGASLAAVDFDQLSKVLFFLRCPRAIIVLTSPANDQVTTGIRNRIAQLVSWAFPNLRQVRMATIAGATPFYSLSIYMEGSVVHAHDVRSAVTAYLFSCWRHRSPDPKKAEAFLEEYKTIVDQTSEITEQQVEEWLGTEELYGDNIGAWRKRIDDHESSWRKYVDTIVAASDTEKSTLRRHSVSSCMLTPRHIAAALRYINYMRHTGKIAKPVVEDE